MVTAWFPFTLFETMHNSNATPKTFPVTPLKISKTAVLKESSDKKQTWMQRGGLDNLWGLGSRPLGALPPWIRQYLLLRIFQERHSVYLSRKHPLCTNFCQNSPSLKATKTVQKFVHRTSGWLNKCNIFFQIPVQVNIALDPRLGPGLQRPVTPELNE